MYDSVSSLSKQTERRAASLLRPQSLSMPLLLDSSVALVHPSSSSSNAAEDSDSSSDEDDDGSSPSAASAYALMFACSIVD